MTQELAVLATLLMIGAAGCRDEGPAERAGRQIDEAVEEAREETKGTLERLGHQVDEVVEETQEAAEEVEESVDEARR